MQPSPEFSPVLAAKKLLREGRSGALATLMQGSGDPYCSLVNVATAAHRVRSSKREGGVMRRASIVAGLIEKWLIGKGLAE